MRIVWDPHVGVLRVCVCVCVTLKMGRKYFCNPLKFLFLFSAQQEKKFVEEAIRVDTVIIREWKYKM